MLMNLQSGAMKSSKAVATERTSEWANKTGTTIMRTRCTLSERLSHISCVLIRHEDFEGFSLHADMTIYSCTDLLEHSASPQILSSASLSMRMTPAVWCSSPAQRRSSSGEIMLTTREGEGEVVRVDVCGTLMLFKKKKKWEENLQMLLSQGRMGWARHRELPDQSVLTCRNAALSRTFHFPQGSWLNALNLSVPRHSPGKTSWW